MKDIFLSSPILLKYNPTLLIPVNDSHLSLFPQYNLDFRGLSPRGGGRGSNYRTDGEDISGSGGGGLSGGGGGSEGGM